MLRHVCGFKLANDGHDTRAIQAYLGHHSIMSAVRYWGGVLSSALRDLRAEPRRPVRAGRAHIAARECRIAGRAAVARASPAGRAAVARASDRRKGAWSRSSLLTAYQLRTASTLPRALKALLIRAVSVFPRTPTAKCVTALTPICVAKFLQNSDANANLAALQKISTSWEQGDYLQKGGWVTQPGATSSDYHLARACAEKLLQAEPAAR